MWGTAMGAEDIRMIIHSYQGGPTGLAKTDLYTGGYSIEKKQQKKGRKIMGGPRKWLRIFLSLGCFL